MSEWYDNQKKPSSNLRKLLQGQIDKASPRRKLTSEEENRHCKLEAIADKLKCGENVQNRQLKTRQNCTVFSCLTVWLTQ
jgi:hypothetical protein